jgi:hypothetical protein
MTELEFLPIFVIKNLMPPPERNFWNFKNS